MLFTQTPPPSLVSHPVCCIYLCCLPGSHRKQQLQTPGPQVPLGARCASSACTLHLAPHMCSNMFIEQVKRSTEMFRIKLHCSTGLHSTHTLFNPHSKESIFNCLCKIGACKQLHTRSFLNVRNAAAWPASCSSLLIARLPLLVLPGQLHCSQWQKSKGDLLSQTTPSVSPNPP